MISPETPLYIYEVRGDPGADFPDLPSSFIGLGNEDDYVKNRVCADRTILNSRDVISYSEWQTGLPPGGISLYRHSLNIAQKLSGKRPLGRGRPLCLPIPRATTVGCPYVAGIPTASADFNACQYSRGSLSPLGPSGRPDRRYRAGSVGSIRRTRV